MTAGTWYRSAMLRIVVVWPSGARSMTQSRMAPAAPAVATASATAGTGAADVAGQAARALVSLGNRHGMRHVSVRLDPPELGRLQIALTQVKDGPARVTVTAERQQTLDLLHRDQAGLQHALDQAGVAREGREITFQLATPAAAAHAANASTTTVPAAPAQAETGFGAGSQPGGGQRNHAGASGGSPTGTTGTAADAADTGPDPSRPLPMRWLASGIDITA